MEFIEALKRDDVEYFSTKFKYDVNMFEDTPKKGWDKEKRNFYYDVLNRLKHSEEWVCYTSSEVNTRRSFGLLSAIFCKGDHIPKVLLWWVGNGNKLDNFTYNISRLLIERARGVWVDGDDSDIYKEIISAFGVDEIPLDNFDSLQIAMQNGRKIKRGEFDALCLTPDEVTLRAIVKFVMSHCLENGEKEFLMYWTWIENLLKMGMCDLVKEIFSIIDISFSTLMSAFPFDDKYPNLRKFNRLEVINCLKSRMVSRGVDGPRSETLKFVCENCPR